jgi:hypothetical protein
VLPLPAPDRPPDLLPKLPKGVGPRFLQRAVHPGQGSRRDADAGAHLVEIGLEALVSPDEIHQELSRFVVQEVVLRDDVAVGIGPAGSRQMLEEVGLEIDLDRIPAVLVLRDDPVPGIAHEGELEVRLELLGRQVSTGDVFAGLEMLQPRRAEPGIVVAAEQERRSGLPGQSHQPEEDLLDAHPRGLRDVDEQAAVLVADHVGLDAYGSKPG